MRIREIQAGVQRVHHGNFAQPIVLASGDELQELADEFISDPEVTGFAIETDRNVVGAIGF